MATEMLIKRLQKAEKELLKDIKEAEQEILTLIDTNRGSVLKRVREVLEETPQMKLARENIERLQLRLELLRNIKMNWNGFQTRLTRKGMRMRINQDTHLNHLIAFLESGKGIATNDVDEGKTESDSEKALMTYEIQPTGAGKTGAFAIDIALMDVPSLILVPFDSLLDQTKRDLLKIGGIPEDQIGIVGGGSKEIGKKHTIATYAGHAAQMKKSGEYATFMRTQCKLVICDEVHHQALGDRSQQSLREVDNTAISNGTPSKEEQEMLSAEQTVISHLASQTAVKSLKIGFTATPRGSQKHVQQYFPHCLGRVYHKEMVDAGLVVPYQIIQCDGSIFPGEIEEHISEKLEAEILEREQVYEKLAGEYADVLATYRTIKEGDSTSPLRGMAFCTNRAECHKFVKEAEKFGLNCLVVTGHEAKGRSGQQVIDAAVKALDNEEYDLLVTVEKLATGFNKPEINAIVWARITSAAKTIQGIGRGARAHIDSQNREKTHCKVFETNWQLLSQGAKRKSKKPISLADALAFNGEDPKAFCSMANGSELKVNHQFILDENGIVDINERLAVGINKYCSATGLADRTTLLTYIKEAGLEPVKDVYVVNSSGRPVDVYWKDEIDAIIPKRLNEKGIVPINNREAIGIDSYASSLEPSIEPRTLLKYIQAAKIQAIPNIRATRNGKFVDVYWKDEVDPLIPKRLNNKGVVPIDNKEAIGIVAYANHLKSISPMTLAKLVEDANLQSISNVIVLSGNRPISIYWKDEVDALIPEQINDNGITFIKDREAIGVAAYAYAQNPRMGNRTLSQYITAAGLTPVPNVNIKSGVRTIEVYWKDEVDAVIKKMRNS